MTTDNVAEMTPGQLRDELAATKRVAQLWFRRAAERKKELAQLQKRLAATVQRCGYCDYEATGADAFNLVAEHIKSCLKHPLAGALAELAQAHRELGCLEGANREYGRQLATAKENRDYWYETCLSTESDLARARQEMQAQSDETQRDWLSPAESKGLRRQLAGAEAQVASAREAAEWLWGFWDGNSLRAMLGFEDDICEAWGRLLVATDMGAAAKLLERLATLDAAEAALTLAQDRGEQLEKAEQRAGGLQVAIDGIHDALDRCKIKRDSSSACPGLTCPAGIATRIRWLIERTTRAEALAQLVKPELAALLERLASFASRGLEWYDQYHGDDPKDARALAARICEALEVNDAKG